MKTISYISGLDLGQAQDYSALAVAELSASQVAKPTYAVRHLERWPRGTSYPDIVKSVVALYRRPPLSGSTLIVDATGVGRAVVDMFRTSGIDARMQALTITGGFRAMATPYGWHVPKKDLVGALQVLLGTRRLRVAPSLSLAKVLAKEMSMFRVKVKANTANEEFSAWRERDHDDIVLAVSLIAFWGERGQAWQSHGLRILPLFYRPACLRIVACQRDELPELAIVNPSLLLCITSPPGNSDCPPHALSTLLDSLSLSFVDIDPDEFALRWAEPLSPWNLTPDKLAVTRDQGKKLFSFLTRKRDKIPEVLVIASDGGKDDRRPLSTALAVADAFFLPRAAIYKPSDTDWKAGKDTAPPNGYIYKTLKSCRNMVTGGIFAAPMPAERLWAK